MAAPHVDNPYGAKGGRSDKDDTDDTDDDEVKGKSGKGKGGKGDKGKKGGKSGKDGKDGGASDSDSDLPKCSHPFCNEPSDPSNFPIGLPWASGLLKCLPGYCAKHRKESIAELSMGLSPQEMEESEFAMVQSVCKCKPAPPVACQHKDDVLKSGKGKECGKPYPKYVYPDDPCVSQELCFFLRMMMVADELDRWQEEDAKKEREEAKKRKEKKKQKKAGGNKEGDRKREKTPKATNKK